MLARQLWAELGKHSVMTATRTASAGALNRGELARLSRRIRRAAWLVAEALEPRRLLSVSSPDTSFDWTDVSPYLLELTVQAEQADPRYALLFNSELADMGVENPIQWLADHPLQQTGAGPTASSFALARPTASRQQAGVRPAVGHLPAVHRRPHKPAGHKPVHRPVHQPAGGVHLLHGPSFHPFLSPPPPTVLSSNFLYDHISLPQQLTFTFNENVAASSWASAISIQDLSTGNALVPSSVVYNSAADTLTVYLNTSASIPDGNYTAMLNGALIHDASNPPNLLTGSDGRQGDPFNYSFFLLAGDCDHNGIVNNSDYFTFNKNYKKSGTWTWDQGDFTYDGKVDDSDYFLLNKNFGENLSLTIPTGVQAVPTTANSVLITWQAVNDPNVTGYDVVRSDHVFYTVNAGASFLDTMATPNTAYTYVVESINSSSQFSPASHPVASATTPSASTLSDTTPPTTPTGLTVTQDTNLPDSALDLSWTASTDNVGVTSYEIDRSSQGDPFVQVGSSTASTFTDTGLVAGAQYTYQIVAEDAAYNRSSSATIMGTVGPDVTAPDPPTGLRVTAVTNTSISLAWNAPWDNVGVTGYKVYRDATLITAMPVSTTTYMDSNLAAQTSLSYWVVAVDAAGNSSQESSSVSGSTNAPASAGFYIQYEGLAEANSSPDFTETQWIPPDWVQYLNQTLMPAFDATFGLNSPGPAIEGKLAYRDLNGNGKYDSTSEPIWVDLHGDSEYHTDDPTVFNPANTSLTDGEWGKKNDIYFYDKHGDGVWHSDDSWSAGATGNDQNTFRAALAGIYQQTDLELLDGMVQGHHWTAPQLLGDLGDPVPPGTGTVSYSAGTLIGSGTQFSQSLQPGMEIMVGSSWFSVEYVTDDTHVTVGVPQGQTNNDSISGATYSTIGWTLIPNRSPDPTGLSSCNNIT